MIKPRLYRGMRDYYPEEMLQREEFIRKIKTVFKNYGFLPLETPAIEYKEILTGKYGGSTEKLIYNLSKEHGNESLSLRYDLTVPLARFVAMNYHHINKPFKRYQIQPVWRAEKAQPNKGRFREFYQCDVDILGVNSSLADLEILSLTFDCLKTLGFENFLIKINHRDILKGLIQAVGLSSQDELEVCRIIDKLDKVGVEGVSEELGDQGITLNQIDELIEILDLDTKAAGTFDILYRKAEKLPDFQKGLARVEEVLNHLDNLGYDERNYSFDLHLARGLDYYTGIIFESILPDFPHIGSLSGGGRYDKLIGIFMDQDIPACGTTIGVDRILTAAKEANISELTSPSAEVLIVLFDDGLGVEVAKLGQELRDNNISTVIYPEAKGISTQLEYADKLNIPVVIFLGENEIEQGELTCKFMKTGEQTTVGRSELIPLLNKVNKGV